MPDFSPITPAPDALAGSSRDFLQQSSADLTAKTAGFSAWLDARVGFGGFPYSKRLTGAPASEATVRLADGSVASGLNFASQDYLALGSHPTIRAAATAAVERYGVHSAGAPVLSGAIDLSDQLEATVADHLRLPHAVLSPTGWAAGYGIVRALVRETDHVVIDQLAHNCLQEGTAAATRNVQPFRHLDLAHARLKLAAIRARDPHHGILVITEGLFSMDADAPDLAGFQELSHEFGAQLLVDVAHDLGATGPRGTGQIGQQNLLGKIDLVVGSFSKSFATNGGFVATRRREVADYVRYMSSPTVFSSALAPAQVAVALSALKIVRSAEGDQRRDALLAAVHTLRRALSRRQIDVMGVASPIVPVFIGRDDIARTAAKLLSANGLLANLIEYPAVSRATARFRLQAMATHTTADAEMAAARIAAAIAAARDHCRNLAA